LDNPKGVYMNYVKGDYKSFKAITKVHLGALESNLEKDEVILFDGSIMKRGTDEVSMPALRAAIKVGWLIPENEEAVYVPKPADIKIHSAVNISGKPQEIKMQKVYEDERGLGSIQDVRPDNAPKTHYAKQAGKTHRLEVDTPDGEGRVVGKFNSSAVSKSVEIGKDDRRVVETLDNKTTLEVEKVATATGDVQEAQTGETLEEILPNSVSTKTPEPGVAGEGRGDESEERANDLVETEVPLTSKEVAHLKIEMLASLVTGFTWDLSAHWKSRVSNALFYKDNKVVLDQILSFESETVVKHVMKSIEE